MFSSRRKSGVVRNNLLKVNKKRLKICYLTLRMVLTLEFAKLAFLTLNCPWIVENFGGRGPTTAATITTPAGHWN